MIVLASSSIYRQQILKNAGLAFTSFSPNINETPQENETAEMLVERLARNKADAHKNHNDFAIGSDQVAVFNKNILGKPHTHEKAFAQLKSFSDQEVIFYTGLAVKHKNQIKSLVEKTTVKFRQLSDELIDHYLKIEKPYDCAGSFKSEGVGILLFQSIKGRDPNSLIGLPMIGLNELFIEFGVDLLLKTQK